MTSSENLQSFDSFIYRTTPFSDAWLSEAFARDTETLTKAFQQSLSSDQSSLSPLPAPTPAAAAHSSGSDPEPPLPRRRSAIPVSTKSSKRRSRATKRATTTFITADAANFRQMVQQVTGVRFSATGGGFAAGAGILKPEPQRAVGRVQGCLPTLDTSAYLLEPPCLPPCSVGPPSSLVADRRAGAGPGFDFESFSYFPTLESGKVMY